MKQQPFISFIIPVYGVENFIRKCLDSIIAQSFCNWEALLIDDGSPDKSGQICDEYAAKDRRFKVFHKINEGVSSARNLGLDNAIGDWIWYVDSDDWIAPNSLEILKHYINKHEPDAVLFGMQYEDIGGNNLGSDTRAYKYGEIDDVIECADYGPPIVLQKRNILEKRSIRFSKGIRMCEDLELQYKFLTSCKKVVQIPDALYYVLRHQGSATQNPNTIRNAAEDIPKVLCNLVEFFKANNIKEKPWIATRINITFKSALFMNYLSKNTDTKYLQRIIRNCDNELQKLNHHDYKDFAVRLGCMDVRLYFFVLKIRKIIR